MFEDGDETAAAPRPLPGNGARGRFLHVLLLAGLALVAFGVIDVTRPPAHQRTAQVLLAAVRTYQSVAPRVRPGRGQCRLRPTCSAYAVTVITRFGALRGGALAARRLLRCGPWTRQGTVDKPPAAPPYPSRRR